MPPCEHLTEPNQPNVIHPGKAGPCRLLEKVPASPELALSQVLKLISAIEFTFLLLSLTLSHLCKQPLDELDCP